MRKGGRCHICMILLAVLFVSTACGTVSDESANPQQSNMEYAPAKSQQLSGEDLAYFNETLFNKGDKSGLQNLFLTQAYNHPKELNLFY